MNLADLNLKISYESKKDDLLSDFYIPSLACAYRYDRISGFFSSASLAIAARGIAGLLQNGGKMRLVTCQRLNPQDVKIIESLEENVDSVIEKNFVTEMAEVEDQFQKDHIQALGWMLANGFLEIKIALVYKNGRLCTADEIDEQSIMHQKVGLMYDMDFNAISFSGSNNESASGWLDNIEEFKVFKNWDPVQKVYFKSDQEKFEQFWKNEREGVKVVDLPYAIKNHLIQASKDFHPEKVALERYYKKVSQQKKEELRLFDFQKEAIEMWNDNGRQLLFEMATGCGKTRTAIGCIDKLVKENMKDLIVIACPQSTLSAQWKKDIDSLNVPIEKSIFIDGEIAGWPRLLASSITQLNVGRYRTLLVYVTHSLAADSKFTDEIVKAKNGVRCTLIGDEAHGMGAPQARRALLDKYDYRIALSATPQRWFDEDGSTLIYEYFGNKSYEFPIEKALNTVNRLTGKPFLVNYYYHPRFIELEDYELEEYKKVSDKIKKRSNMTSGDDEAQKFLQFMLFQRANMEKNAENKYKELAKILDEIPDISDTIIFVSDEQLPRVLQMLGNRGIRAHKFTKDEGKKKEDRFGGISEREYLIDKFVSGDYQVLVAIKCLDEGIDIPSAKRAIVMASSTNPREYVQRIGRIIRQEKNRIKESADIYDLIIKPNLEGFDEEFAQLELRVFNKEMTRVKDLSKNSLNNALVLSELYKILREVTL